MSETFAIEALSPHNVDAFSRLMEDAGTGCYCRYWHFAGDKNAWLARMAFDAGTNRSEQERSVATHDGTALGLLAMREGLAIGWLKVSKREHVRKLVQLGPYRRSISDEDGVYAIACLYVAEAHRRQGIGRALVQRAPAFVAELGGTVLEAFPRVVDETLADAQLMLGAARMFEGLGFHREGGEDTFPHLRLRLTPAT